MGLREIIVGSPWLKARARRLLELRVLTTDRLARPVSFEHLPGTIAVRLAYQVLLGRDPDREGLQAYGVRVAAKSMTRRDVVEALRGSEEFQVDVRFGPSSLRASIHAGRSQFIRSLPRARSIVDLGGTHLRHDVGALVAMGYPYAFEELTIVDLPSEDRHAIYRSDQAAEIVDSRLGPVSYAFHSMTDLSGFADESVDLVYSGQSIEHVIPAEGSDVLRQVHRILRPGGHLALDTPNARVTRLESEEFIDPDHKVEYTPSEIVGMAEEAGFVVSSAQGLNYAGRSVATGRFDLEEVVGNSGLHAAYEDCYILCLVCRKAP